MMLEITIGATICVRYDDCMEDVRLTPELVEDYLTRMRRTAVAMYDSIPDDDDLPDVDEALAALEDEGEA